jgi:MFS transporter, PPP family, 3-phenylpropionic acid transporter
MMAAGLAPDLFLSGPRMDADLRRFAVFYFCYYAALGAYTPYIGRWVTSLGHGGYVVGTMLVLWYGTRIIAPPLWARRVERSATPGHWFVAGAALTALCFAGFTLTRSAWALFAVMTVFGLFYNAVMPQFEAMTLKALGKRSAFYGRIRVWGSIGFLIVASTYGWLLDRLGDGAFPWISLPLFAAILVAAWLHRDDIPPDHIATASDAGHLWQRPGVRSFLIIALLMQMGFGAFYVFYTLHLQAHGHDGAHIGALWGLGVLIEIAMFWQAPRLLARFGTSALMSLCLALTIARWTAVALLADSFGAMAAAQLTHAFSFAIFHACCMRRMANFFPGKRAAVGQSLLYAFSQGVGGVLGAGLAAMMWEWRGGTAAFLAGAGVTVIALALHLLRSRGRDPVLPVATGGPTSG